MEWQVWLAVLLPLGVAGISGWGALQVRRLHAWLPDPRLVRLFVFLGLFAAAWAVHGVGVWLFHRQGDILVERDAFGAQDVLFLLHHGLLLGAMAVAALVYRPPRPAPDTDAPATGPAALAPLLFWLEPTLRLVETVGFFYLAARTAWNHRTRRDLGSLRVAVGFLLLLSGHAWLLYLHTPLGPHDVAADVLALVGTVMIVSALPRRRG